MSQDFRTERDRMVEEQLVRRGIRNPRVLEAMRRVPRHMFVPGPQRSFSYTDAPVALPLGQTVSQPYIVALMTEVLDPHPDDRVLEIGTGSGYQTAVLAELAGEVFTIERHPELAEEARLLLEEMGFGNVRFRVGDGTLGWPEKGPFDGILVTAAAPSLPDALAEQVGEGGRIVIPLGDKREQELYRFTRRGDRLKREWITTCRFVPLVGEEGWSEP